MVIDRLINQDNTPMLEQVLQFTEARQQLIADNIANVSTPNYRQKDLSVEGFQAQLQSRVAQQQEAAPGATRFDDISYDQDNPTAGILAHDGNNRSIEQLMTENAKNALMHNMAVELLRRQYQTMEMALKERVS